MEAGAGLYYRPSAEMHSENTRKSVNIFSLDFWPWRLPFMEMPKYKIKFISKFPRISFPSKPGGLASGCTRACACCALAADRPLTVWQGRTDAG